MNIKKISIFLLLIAMMVSCISGCNIINKADDVSDNEEDIKVVKSDDEFEVTTDENMRNTVLYYKNENGFIVPVMRKIPWEEGIAKAALRNITDSPTVREDINAIGLEPIIPAGVGIKGMSIDKETGVCNVDFTDDILNYDTEDDEYNLVKGIVYTLTEFPSISKVKILINGKSNTMKFGTKLSQALLREDINYMAAEGEHASKVVVYYKSTTNGEYEYYVPVTIPILAPNANVSSALQALFDGPPEFSGLYTDIPGGVALQGIEVNNSIAYVDLSVEDISLLKDQATYDAMSTNIGLTLEQFNEIAEIKIMIDGQTLEEAGLDLVDDNAIPVFANEY
ncbi:GerMN domain-containing protein [Clostridiaceae bacterium M8S5]|nr:GerMN domain-containing protein [Clostridiaceae bacterium M8S5]